MQKVSNLESIIHEGKKPQHALSTTSKFGAGAQLPKNALLEDSVALQQNSLKSGSTFTDLMMNTSKLEPTDTSQMNLNMSQSIGSNKDHRQSASRE